MRGVTASSSARGRRCEGLEVEIDRDGHEPVRAQDPRHVGMCDGGDEHLVSRREVEGGEKAVEPGAYADARDRALAGRPRTCDAGRSAIGPPCADGGSDREE